MSRSTTKTRVLGAGVAATLAAAALVGVAGTASAAPGGTGTASPTLGTNAGGNVVAITGTGLREANGALAVGTPKVSLGTATTAATCTNTTYAAAAAVGAWSVVSATRANVTMPAATLPGTTTSIKAAVCFPVVGSSTAYVAVPYTYAKPAALPATNKVLPVAGPMSGGQTVTVYAASGTGFQANATVLIGGVPALTPKVAVGGASIAVVTPVTPTAGAKDVVVRSPGFADLKIAGGYSFTRAISVSPAVGATGTATDITIKGAGFLSDTYGDHDGNGATPAKSLKVYLSDGQQFDSAGDPVVPTLCGNLQIVSDTELSCEVPAGVAAPLTITVSDDAFADKDAANDSVISRGAIFVRADF